MVKFQHHRITFSTINTMVILEITMYSFYISNSYIFVIYSALNLSIIFCALPIISIKFLLAFFTVRV